MTIETMITQLSELHRQASEGGWPEAARHIARAREVALAETAAQQDCLPGLASRVKAAAERGGAGASSAGLSFISCRS